MIFCLVLFLVELGLTHYVIEGTLPLGVFLCLHGAGLLGAYFVLRHKQYQFKYINLYLLTLLLTLVSGVLGAATGLLSALLFFYNRNKTTNNLRNLGIEEDEKSDEEPQLIASLSEGDLKSKAHVLPFLEIIKVGNNHQKVEALSKISQHYRPEFAKALLEAKTSAANNVRVLAASTISKIDQTFMRRYKNLSFKHHQNPDSQVVLLNLARHANAYADCGVLDTYRQKHFREKAIEGFNTYLKLCPGHKEAQLTLAKLYLKTGQPQKSVEIFQNLLKHKVKLDFVDLFWYVEALYDTGKIHLIRAQINQFERLGLLKGGKDLFIINDIFKPWATGHLKSGGAAP